MNATIEHKQVSDTSTVELLLTGADNPEDVHVLMRVYDVDGSELRLERFSFNDEGRAAIDTRPDTTVHLLAERVVVHNGRPTPSTVAATSFTT